MSGYEYSYAKMTTCYCNNYIDVELEAAGTCNYTCPGNSEIFGSDDLCGGSNAVIGVHKCKGIYMEIKILICY